jgi:hypothetical protein
MAAFKVIAYLVKAAGQSQYTEILRAKTQARQAAKDLAVFSPRVSITPLYAGREQRYR